MCYCIIEAHTYKIGFDRTLKLKADSFRKKVETDHISISPLCVESRDNLIDVRVSISE